MKQCEICKAEISHRSYQAKYCEDCIPIADKRTRKIAYENFKKREAKKREARKRHETDYKKPTHEAKSRLDRKSFWDNRDTSCDGSQYF